VVVMLEPEHTNGQSTPSHIAALQSDPESVREANRPRSRCAELLVSLFIALVVHFFTVWIVLSIAVPLIWHQYWFAYEVLLSVLGFCALGVSAYVFQIGIGAFQWTRKYRALKDTDWYTTWLDKWGEASQNGHANEVLEWTKVHHYVVVTNYKEPIDMLKLLAYSLMSQKCANFCKNQITLVFAMEEREGEPEVKQKADILLEELGAFFYEVLATFHPPDLAGDIKGKASNYKWAVKEVEAHIREAARRGTGHSEDYCLIHVADADSLYDPNYFPNVTYHFCVDPDRYHLVWQPCMIPTCNFWDLAAPCRQVNTMIAAQEMMSAHDPYEFQIPFSTYGTALKTLQLIGGTGDAADAQDGDVIAEDHHLFIKGYFASEGRLRVQPIFLPCLNFAVGGDTQPWCSNIRDRFVQAKRHMFGISEFIYFIVILLRGKWCRRKRFGCHTWARTLGLFWKLLKIHSIPYLGLWVGLGLALVAMLKGFLNYCDQDKHNLTPSSSHQVCHDLSPALNQQMQTWGAVVFSVATTSTFAGSIFLIFSFVRMLHATHHTLMNIADPNGSFMDMSIWEQETFEARRLRLLTEAVKPRSPRSSPLMESAHEDTPEALPSTACSSSQPATLSSPVISSFSPSPGSLIISPLQQHLRGTRRPRRPIPVGGGFPWLGTVLQMAVEFAILGFFTSLVFGSIPAIIGLYKLIFQGHRMEYVTAPKPGTAARNNSVISGGSSTAVSLQEVHVPSSGTLETTGEARAPLLTRSSRPSGI